MVFDTSTLKPPQKHAFGGNKRKTRHVQNDNTHRMDCLTCAGLGYPPPPTYLHLSVCGAQAPSAAREHAARHARLPLGGRHRLLSTGRLEPALVAGASSHSPAVS